MENISYNFEEFTSFGSKFSPKISLGKTGGFGFSSGFCHRYNINDTASLKIYFDKSKNAVGFRFFDKIEDGTVKLKLGRTGGHLAARSFLGKYGIDPAKFSGRYDPKEITDGNAGKMYVIELKERSGA